MQRVKYLILGAGPAGLVFARRLKDYNETSFLVLDREEEAGGLCRSEEVDGSPFDIGGGHFLDVTRPEANEYLFCYMPESEWDYYERDSRIEVNGAEIGHPFEANIWQMDLEDQVEYLISISNAGCNRDCPMPDKFTDWIKWKLGEKVAEDYMLPYNRKMFADELNELGTYWLEKLPNVSFEETLKSCLMRKPYGTQPGHAHFYYPKKFGYGEVWRRMADSIAEHIVYNQTVCSIDCEQRMVCTISGERYSADHIITTIPWTEFVNISGMPRHMVDSIKQLKYSSIETRYVAEELNTEAHWLYIPDPAVPYHRILVRHNFCRGSRGYWLETRRERTGEYENETSFHYMNEYAYPLNTISKPVIMQELLAFARSNNIYGLGRWGEHSHYNSDLVVQKALELAESVK